jgi:hypothetical protein
VTLIIEIAVGVPSNHLSRPPRSLLPAAAIASAAISNFSRAFPLPPSCSGLSSANRQPRRFTPPHSASFSSSEEVPWVNFAEEQPRDCTRLIFNRPDYGLSPSRSLARSRERPRRSRTNQRELERPCPRERKREDGKCPTDFICNEIGCVVTFITARTFFLLRRVFHLRNRVERARSNVE